MKRGSLLVNLFLFMWLTGFSVVLRAEEPEPGVARVSLTNGEVSTMRGDSGDWVATTINTPLVQGDKIATGQQSRTEVQLDYANILRLDQNSQARIADLSGKHIQVQLSEGLLNLTVLARGESDVEIDTPSVAVRPLGEGVYRIQVSPSSDTVVIVRKGEAELSTSQGNTRVKSDELITVRGQDNPEYQITQAPHKDSWDDWNISRDRTIRDASSWQHANSYYTGLHDLDSHGRWENVPGYDYVWSPNVDEGWAPYREGRWVWEPYWGWTWVSYEPWGWAPYHYGRWFQYNSSWCWWPGPAYGAYRPIWAPAYVSFFGFGFGGRNWSFGFGFGYNSIGWLPVGPCDYYYPWHGHRNYYNTVNVTNIIHNGRGGYGAGGIRPLADTGRQPYYSNLQTALNNPRSQHGLTAVSTENFVQGRMGVHDRITNSISLRDAQLVRGTVPAVPTRESLRSVDRAVNSASLPRQPASSQQFFTKRQPPAGTQSFNQRVAELRRMVQVNNPQSAAGRGGDFGQGRAALAANSPDRAGLNGRSATSNNPISTFSGQRNQITRSTDRPVAGSSPATPTASQSGWQRFSSSGRGSSFDRSSVAPSGSSQVNRGVDRFARPDRPPSIGTQSVPRFDRYDRTAPADRSFHSFPSRSQPSNSQADRFPSSSATGSTSRPEMRSPSSSLGSMSSGRARTYEAPRSYSRPPLQMNRPIVTQRSSGDFGGGGRQVTRSDSRGSSPASSPRSSGHGRR